MYNRLGGCLIRGVEPSGGSPVAGIDNQKDPQVLPNEGDIDGSKIPSDVYLVFDAGKF